MSNEKRKINKKKVLLICLIIFFFLVIFILWLSNFLRVIHNSSINLVPKGKSEEVSDIKKSFGDLVDQVNKAKENQEINLAEEIKTEDELIIPVEPVIKEDVVDKELTKNCPAYVNCMPMIDSVINCSIPVGCEGVTQLVY